MIEMCWGEKWNLWEISNTEGKCWGIFMCEKGFSEKIRHDWDCSRHAAGHAAKVHHIKAGVLPSACVEMCVSESQSDSIVCVHRQSYLELCQSKLYGLSVSRLLLIRISPYFQCWCSSTSQQFVFQPKVQLVYHAGTANDASFNLIKRLGAVKHNLTRQGALLTGM